jgi:hypothetical protein
MTHTSLDDPGPVDYLVVEAVELADVGELGELQALEAQLAELLAEEDVEHLAAAMEPNRIPIQAIIASIEAENAPTSVGP